MRLAKRTYRAKKKAAQESERTRVDELSSALDDSLSTFSTLPQNMIHSLQSRGSPNALIYLNDAVSQFTAIASHANKFPFMWNGSELSGYGLPQQRPESLNPTYLAQATREQYSESNLKHAGAGALAPNEEAATDSGAVTISLRSRAHGNLPVSSMLMRACTEIVVSILSDGKALLIHPQAMALPLQHLGKELLMYSSLQRLSLFHLPVFDAQYPPHASVGLPRMYRVIEGGSIAVPRIPSPSLQQIVRGTTRTILDTTSAELQGEWLEAVDVEEYLEERGISLHSHGSGDAAPSQPDSMGPGASSPPQPGPHEPGVYSVFGLPGPGGRFGPSRSRGQSELRSTTRSGEVLSGLQPAASGPTDGIKAKAPRVMVDLDKLVGLLAANAVCLGPGPGIRRDAVDMSIRESCVISR